MVLRGVYYAEGVTVKCKIVSINWDLGFTREAKHEYTQRIIDTVNGTCGRIAEVTSSAANYRTRMLSPIFIKMRTEPYSMLEDYLQELNKTIPNIFQYTPLVDYYYITNLSNENLKTLHEYDAYCDVFHNPSKGWGNTQAESLAVLRALENDNRTHLLSDYRAFLGWYTHVLKTEFV